MTPTHTSRVEVPSRMPHTSYDDKFYMIDKKNIYYINSQKLCGLTIYGLLLQNSASLLLMQGFAPHYLGLDSNLNEAADDGEHVADDEQDVPTVDELHPVSPAHTPAKPVFEELHILL